MKPGTASVWWGSALGWQTMPQQDAIPGLDPDAGILNLHIVAEEWVSGEHGGAGLT